VVSAHESSFKRYDDSTQVLTHFLVEDSGLQKRPKSTGKRKKIRRFRQKNPRNQCKLEVVFQTEGSSDFSGDFWPFDIGKNRILTVKIRRFSDPNHCYYISSISGAFLSDLARMFRSGFLAIYRKK